MVVNYRNKFFYLKKSIFNAQDLRALSDKAKSILQDVKSKIFGC